MNFNLTASHSNLNVATAWLLSTLGSRNSCKKVLKKDILTTSIIETCKVMTNSQIPLRFSSNLMYGVTLLYRQKVDYFYSDVSLVLSRLQRDLIFGGLEERGRETLNVEVRAIPPEYNVKNAGQLYLVEDPLFDVNIDFLVPFQENPDQFDLNRHLLHDEVLVTDTIRVLEDYEVSEEGGILEDTAIDFGFDINGMMVNEDKLEDMNIDLDLDMDMDMDMDMETDLVNTSLEVTVDLQNEEQQLQKGYRPKLKRLAIDRGDLSISIEQYDRLRRGNMIIGTEGAKFIPAADLIELVAEESKNLTPFLNLCYLQIFGGKVIDFDFKRHKSLSYEEIDRNSRFGDEIEFSRRTGASVEEIEASRRLAIYGEDSGRGLGIAEDEILRRLDNATTVENNHDIDIDGYDYNTEDSLTFNQSLDISLPEVMSDFSTEDELRTNLSESGEGDRSSNAKTLSRFLSYVYSRTKLLGIIRENNSNKRKSNENKEDETEYTISFRKLVPIESVSKKVAAASFASVLVLTTNSISKIELNIRNEGEVFKDFNLTTKIPLE